jgi:hypothetical protein
MSYLSETATLEFDPNGSNNNGTTSSYDYHLPHTKTIDLIGEEFAPKSRSSTLGQGQAVVVENIGGIPTSMGPNVVLVNTSGGSGGVPFHVQQILQQAQQHQVSLGCSQISNNFVSVTSLSQAMASNSQQQQTFTLASLPQNSSIVSSSGGGSPTVVIQQPQQPQEYSFQTSPGATTGITVDLPSIQQSSVGPHGVGTSAEENGVLLCNLDDLSRYIPENFYSDFTMADQQHGHQQSGGVPDYLQTVVAGKAITTTVSSAGSNHTHTASNAIQIPMTMTNHQQPQSITIQLPTQPQPIQGVKTITYVNTVMSKGNPVTQYAYTPSGNIFTEAGHILYLRILYPIHIQAQKKDIISYHYHGKKRIYKRIYHFLLCQNFASIVTVSEQQKARPGSSTQVLDFLPDQSKTLIYQQHSKEIANHSRNGRNSSAKGKILPLKPKISGTER